MTTAPKSVGDLSVAGAAATRTAVWFWPLTTSWKKKWRWLSFSGSPSRPREEGEMVRAKRCVLAAVRGENKKKKKEKKMREEGRNVGNQLF